MARAYHPGAQPLDDTGLVAFLPCGHWWIYPTRADAEQMHELARFNLGIACSFCLVAWLDTTYVRACETATRMN